MSDDDDRSDSSSSDGEDIETTGLIATRSKRAGAGNLYATLRANLDDEELQKELLAEDEEGDAGDYEGSDKGDEDSELEASSDEEDAGPPKGGENEDLEGEKALKRQERVEAKKKRKVHEAKLKLPAWQKKNKRVKIAAEVKAEDGSTTPIERPRKKSERSNWLPSAADAPVRQSARASAVTNREIIHANLKQSAERSEKQKRVMKDHAERDRTKRRNESITQEERLKKCEKIERETAKDFGRWEREENERQKAREEALAAKRKKGLGDVPFVRYWSGSAVWEGERMKVRRVSHGSKGTEELQLQAKEEKEKVESSALDAFKKGEFGMDSVAVEDADADVGIEGQNKQQKQASELTPAKPSEQASTENGSGQNAQTQPPVSWLQGIQEYASQPESTKTTSISDNASSTANTSNTTSQPAAQFQQQPSDFHSLYQAPPDQPSTEIYHGWPPGTHQFPIYPAHPLPQTPVTAAPAPPAPPPLREQALRTLLVLTNFPSLNTTAPREKKTWKSKPTTPASTTTEDNLLPLKRILLPSPPTLTSEESKYLLTKSRKRTNLNEHPLPPPPNKAKCAITCWKAKFRDPKTGLAYADLHQYKAIQRLVAGGCAWSGVVGGFVGPRYGAMGRPARGVPEGFAGLPEIVGAGGEDAS